MRSYRFRIGSLTAVGALLMGAPACSSSPETRPSDPTPQIPVDNSDEAAASAVIAQTPLGRVDARDERGNVRAISGRSSDVSTPLRVPPESAARLHLAHHARVLGSTEAGIRSAVVTGTHSLAGGGSIVQFGQRVNGVEVFRSRTVVVLDADKNLVNIGNGLAPATAVARVGKSASFTGKGRTAVANAYSAHTGIVIDADAVKDAGARTDDVRNYEVRTPSGALQVLEATAKPVYYPAGGRLIPAYYVEFMGRAAGTKANQAWGIVVSANDGKSLSQTSLTAHEAFTYRVWASPTGDKVPMDGPIVDSTPYPGNAPNAQIPANAPSALVSIDGFNKTADPWLAADATVTFGNNVQAYSDRNQYTDDAGVNHNNGYQEGGATIDSGGDFRADITAPRTFDRNFDLTIDPGANVNQIKAAVTQLFYTNNWLHDFWYDSGFDEAAGNAQLSNLGRMGGVGNDPILAEAQDSVADGEANNANMSTPSDGMSPRMQMYVWNGLPNRNIVTNPAVTFTDGFGAAGFGPQVFNRAATPTFLANDGSTDDPSGAGGIGTTSDACQEPTNVNNRIAVIDRGLCAFSDKVLNAQAGGAVGVILINNAPGNAPVNPGGGDPSITIPVLGLSLEDGTKLKAQLAMGNTTATLVRGVETKRDGTVDNGIVAHEWGHYWHHRLVLCGSKSCDGMSEGWGDFASLMMIVKEGDTFGPNVYPLAQFAMGGLDKNSGYFGIRRAPYAEDHTKNPFTFGHIRQMATNPTGAPLAPGGADMSEVHNVGEIWAQALFQGYIKLLAAGTTAARPFADSRRRMADYLVAGMKATPADPTFVEQRDSILRPIYVLAKTDATRKADFDALARGFADRGLGTGAIAPPISSQTLNEAVENFDIKGALGLEEIVKLDDSVRSCDNDGILDAGEQGKLTFTVTNNGWETLTGSTVKVTTTDPNLTLGAGGMVTVASLEPYGVSTVTVDVTAKAGITQRGLATLTFTLENAAAVKPSVPVTVATLYNYDDKDKVSASDDVESNRVPTAWEPKQGVKLPVFGWARDGDAKNHFWHGNDTGMPTDEMLVSPSLVVNASTPFVINFSHRYSFEFDEAGGIYYDGAVIELSEDDGMTWKDVNKYAGINPGYSATINSSSPPPPEGGAGDAASTEANALAGREGFGGESPGYPNFVNTSLDFGATALAGKTVRVRFRIGTDEGAGAPGWDIDNFSFGGPSFSSLSNTPFSALVNNAGICGDGGTDGGGVVDAGRDVGSMNDAPRIDVANDAPRADGPVSDAPVSDAPVADGAVSDTGRDSGRGGSGGSTFPDPPPASDDCGCSVPGGHGTTKSSTLLAALGALSFVMRRRRRTAR